MERNERSSVERQGNQPVPSELREKAIQKNLEENPKMDHHTQVHMADQMKRNGRWGTCSGCPRETVNDIEELTYGHGNAKVRFFPEQCSNTNRYDHWFGVDALDEE